MGKHMGKKNRAIIKVRKKIQTLRKLESKLNLNRRYSKTKKKTAEIRMTKNF